MADFALGIFEREENNGEQGLLIRLKLRKLMGEDVNTAEMEGKTFYVLCCVNGVVHCVKARVKKGEIVFRMEKLGDADVNKGYTQFVLLEEEVFEEMWEAEEIPAENIVNEYGTPLENY